MVVIDKYNSAQFNSLTNTKGRILYDTTLNVVRYNNNTDYNNFLISKDSNSDVSGINNVTLGGNLNITNHNGSTTGLKLNGSLVTATAEQLNYNIVTAGTASASKALVLDSNRNISNIHILTADNINLTNLNTTGNIGINTSALDYGLEINESTGNVLRLSYNDSNGGPSTNRVDFQVSSTGTLSITPVGTAASINIVGHDGSTKGLQLDGNLITSTAAQLNFNNVTAGAGAASKTLVLDSNRNINNINSLNTTGNVGINTLGLDFGLEVNHSIGNCLRLSNNDSDGSSVTKCDFIVSSSGSLSIVPSGANPTITLTGNVSTVSMALTKQAGVDGSVDFPLSLTSLPYATPTIGNGSGIEFNCTNDNYTIFSLGTLEFYSTDITDGAEYSHCRIRVSNNDAFYTAMDLSTNGVMSVTSIIETSDIRMKENIEKVSINDSVKKVLQLESKSYNYINDNDKKMKTGFIAQEVKEIFPEVVDIAPSDDFEDLHRIHYTQLIPHLVNCIKDLYKELKELKEKLAEKETL